VRNPSRNEIPTTTLLQAARLAAFYSDARELTKAAVRYTPRKFVNKPKKAAPGLVSVASFKTILVQPDISDLSPA
jgi:predicted ribosome quality control (RQC) complex YloA/Tae2 family protein